MNPMQQILKYYSHEKEPMMIVYAPASFVSFDIAQTAVEKKRQFPARQQGRR